MSVKRKVLIILIPLFLVLTLGFGFAATVKAVEFDEDGIIDANEVIDDDLFIGSETVEINGTVNGDVFAAGSVVKVNGTVNGSLVTGAQSVFVNGLVDGSVYAGSSTFTLGSEAEIGRNVYYGGFNLSAEPGSKVEKDLLVGAYQALLSGQVGRDVLAGVGALEIDGFVGNDVIAEVAGPSQGQQSYYFSSPPGVDTIIPSGIRISKDAEIGGSITYKSSEDQSDAIEISPAGGVTFEYNPDLDPEMVDPDEVGRVGSTALVGTWLLKRVRVFITLSIHDGRLPRCISCRRINHCRSDFLWCDYPGRTLSGYLDNWFLKPGINLGCFWTAGILRKQTGCRVYDWYINHQVVSPKI